MTATKGKSNKRNRQSYKEIIILLACFAHPQLKSYALLWDEKLGKIKT